MLRTLALQFPKIEKATQIFVRIFWRAGKKERILGEGFFGYNFGGQSTSIRVFLIKSSNFF